MLLPVRAWRGRTRGFGRRLLLPRHRRVLHQAPLMMKRLRTDAGAIKFVLSGADIMCPGLTHPDAVMHDEAEVDEPVAIYAHG